MFDSYKNVHTHWCNMLICFAIPMGIKYAEYPTRVLRSLQFIREE